MILTLKIKIVDWSCDIAIDDSSTFEDLHYAIQAAVDFDDDHLYEFFIANTERSRNRSTITSYEDADSVTLDTAIPIQRGKKLFYLFDYGDNWIFRILPSRKMALALETGTLYPKLLSEKGEKPLQYPDWDE